MAKLGKLPRHATRGEISSGAKLRLRLYKLSRRRAIQARERFETIIPSHRGDRVKFFEREALKEFGSRPSKNNVESKTHSNAIHRLFERLTNDSIGLLDHQDIKCESVHWSKRGKWDHGQFERGLAAVEAVDAKLNAFLEILRLFVV